MRLYHFWWRVTGGKYMFVRNNGSTMISQLVDTIIVNSIFLGFGPYDLTWGDIGGIIVIDFIDMEVARNRDAVLLRLRESLAKDKTRTQVFEVSHLGLVEMTRKNVSEGLLESFSEVCPHCEGRGVMLFEEAATEGTAIPEVEAAS